MCRLVRLCVQVFPTLASKAAGLDWAAAGKSTRTSAFPVSHCCLTPHPAGGSSAAPQFVTEAELEELKATRGGTVEDGTLSVDKPLYEVLRENKEKKACACIEGWREVRADVLRRALLGGGVSRQVAHHEAREKQAARG